MAITAFTWKTSMSQSYVVSLHPPPFSWGCCIWTGDGIAMTSHQNIPVKSHWSSQWSPIKPANLPMKSPVGRRWLAHRPWGRENWEVNLTSGCQPPLTPRSKLFRFLLSLVLNSSYPGLWFQTWLLWLPFHIWDNPNPISGWWFQTFFMLHNIWDTVIPTPLTFIFFKMVIAPPTRSSRPPVPTMWIHPHAPWFPMFFVNLGGWAWRRRRCRRWQVYGKPCFC